MMASLHQKTPHWLVLAGTEQARNFISYWQKQSLVMMTASLAGVTKTPPSYGVPTRIGGFSTADQNGKDGLADYIKDHSITAIIDFTHPFAHQISAHARYAADRAQVLYCQYMRPAWQAGPDDDWHYHDSWPALFGGVQTETLFLSGGHEALQHLPELRPYQVVARMIEAPKKARDDVTILLSRPSADVADEIACFTSHDITALAVKDSGGAAGEAKLSAARFLNVPVHMVKRPDYPAGWFSDISEMNAYLHDYLKHDH